MDVVKVTIGDREWILDKRYFSSLEEYSNRFSVALVKGTIPESEHSSRITLPQFLQLLNGGRCRRRDFNFKKGTWTREPETPRVRTFRNATQRARAIRALVKARLEAGEPMNADRLAREIPGLATRTYQGHIRAVADELRNNNYRVDSQNGTYRASNPTRVRRRVARTRTAR